MIPVLVFNLKEEAWKIYLRPTIVDAAINMQQTYGSKYDRVERESVTGGISTVWPSFPQYFLLKEQALASINNIIIEE